MTAEQLLREIREALVGDYHGVGHAACEFCNFVKRIDAHLFNAGAPVSTATATREPSQEDLRHVRSGVPAPTRDNDYMPPNTIPKLAKAMESWPDAQDKPLPDFDSLAAPIAPDAPTERP